MFGEQTHRGQPRSQEFKFFSHSPGREQLEPQANQWEEKRDGIGKAVKARVDSTWVVDPVDMKDGPRFPMKNFF